MVGESGSGKSHAGVWSWLWTAPARAGWNCWSRNLHRLSEQAARARRDFQMVFQDPYGSLDPRMTVEAIVSGGLLGNDSAKAQSPCRRQQC